jgi:hypothetical protein
MDSIINSISIEGILRAHFSVDSSTGLGHKPTRRGHHVAVVTPEMIQAHVAARIIRWLKARQFMV